MATEISRGWGGGVSKKRQFQTEVGGCYRGLFPGGLSEKAVSYLLLPVFQNKYYNLFALINFRFLGNYPPTPLLSQHFGLCKKYVIMMALERGRWAPRNLN